MAGRDEGRHGQLRSVILASSFAKKDNPAAQIRASGSNVDG